MLRRDAPQSGKALTVLLVTVALLGIIWLLSNAIMVDARQGVILVAAAITVIWVGQKTLSDWRTGLYLFVAWLLFEDLIRKYMGNSMYVYFGKDILIGTVYASLLMARLRGEYTDRFRVPFKFALGLFVLLGLAQIFNSGSPSLWYGVLGMKLYFYYMPLMFVSYALLREERDLRRFLVVSSALAIPIATLGIAQAILGLNFLNPHSGADIEELGHLTRVTPSGLLVTRPPSVFVSDGRFADFLTLAFILALGTAGYLLLRRQTSGRRIVFPALALVALATTVSGGRGVFVYACASAVLLSVGMLWGAPSKVGAGYRLVKAIRRSFVFVVLVISFAVVVFPDVVGPRWAFYQETLSPNSADSEVSFRMWDYPVYNLMLAFTDPVWPVGHGIGTASLGIQYVSRILEVPTAGITVESGYGQLLIEFGILGPILWLLWTSSLLYAAFRTTMKLKGTWAFPVAFAILWFIFYLLFPRTFGGIVGYQDFVLNAYLWLLVGVLFRLPALVAQEHAPELTVEPARVTAPRLTAELVR